MSSCVKCFYLKTRCSKKYIAFAHVELSILLILTYCLLVVFAPCLKSKFITFVTVTELITVPFGEISHTTCVLYFFDSRSWKKNCYLTVFFITRFQYGNCQLMWRDSIPIDNSCSVYNLYFCFSLLCFGNCSGSILGLTVCRLACLKGYTKKYRDHGCLRMVSDHFNLFYVCCIWGYKTLGLFSWYICL